jgi:RNA polymerase sigma-B factor
VDRFDPARDVDFLSFAVPTISGEVLRHFRDRATMIRMPRRLRTLQSMIYDAADEFAQRHGRAARPSEIARHLGVDVETVLEGLAAQGAGHTASLDEPASGGAAAQVGVSQMHVSRLLTRTLIRLRRQLATD